jgi:hypothetical protein
VTTIQKITAALRELLAETPDLDEVRSIVSEIPSGDRYAAGSALVKLAGMISYSEASARVKAGAS